jgi:hypothetical protein
MTTGNNDVRWGITAKLGAGALAVSCTLIAALTIQAVSILREHDNKLSVFEATHTSDGDVRKIFTQEIRYPWLADREIVMRALTDSKSSITSMRDIIDQVRAEQIEQRLVQRLNGQKIDEIRSILKGGVEKE